MRRSAPSVRHAVQVLILGMLAAPLVGCGLFKGAVLLWGKEPTREVPAEYPYLPGKKVCVLVWAESFTLFEYPHVQLDVSEFVRVALTGAIDDLTVQPNRPIVEYQRNNPEWAKEHPASIGSRFGADRVLVVELTQYTTREPDSPHLYRGRIAANVKVYDSAYPDAQYCYKTSIETAYPPDSVGAYGTSDRNILKATMQAFATELAGKFYDRQEKVK